MKIIKTVYKIFYNNQVVTAEEAKSANVFWTVSASSVTMVVQKKSDPFENDLNNIVLSDCYLTPMIQWINEKHIFDQISKRKTFIYYR